MRKLLLICFFTAITAVSYAADSYKDVTSEIPEIPTSSYKNKFRKVLDLPEYTPGNWGNVVGIARNVTKSHAFHIAESNPDITFFFYIKPEGMMWEGENGTYRLFHKGDAIFFTGGLWLDSTPGDSFDVYVKIQE